MRTPALAATLAAPLLAAPLLAAALAGPAAPTPDRPAPDAPALDAPTPAEPARAAEVRRIRLHFDSVLAELPRRDLAALAPAQRARRLALLDTLRAYRDRGDFPRNHDFPGQAVPYFVDRGTGTLCAVAYLLAASGRRDVVDRVARADNNVWVPALAGDTAFTGWLAASGLTLAEAARIQVPYVGDPPSGPAPTAARGSAPYTAASAAALGGAVAASVWNARANARGASRTASVLGVTAGVAAVGMGAVAAGSAGGRPALGAANFAVGAASLWLGTRGIRRHRADLRADAAAREATRRASVTPIVPAGPNAGAGALLAVRF